MLQKVVEEQRKDFRFKALKTLVLRGRLTCDELKKSKMREKYDLFINCLNFVRIDGDNGPFLF